ncbi:MAG: SagB/ThcOx family dehydrogenase [Actinomycetota bacterium]
MTRSSFAVVACAALLLGCTERAPDSILDQNTRFTEVAPLPTPDNDGATPLEAVLEQRRSGRSFRGDPLALQHVGQLLWAGQGITDADGHRTAPSAGARYPIELYAVTPDSVGHYLPADHALQQRADTSAFALLADSAFGQDFVSTAPLIVVVTGVVARTRVEYGAAADDLMQREAGHVAQNVLLQATALGLAAVPVGGFDPAAAARSLALPPGEDVLYLIPAGHPAR